jgi:uncharacterized protein (DUF2147 family)
MRKKYDEGYINPKKGKTYSFEYAFKEHND